MFEQPTKTPVGNHGAPLTRRALLGAAAATGAAVPTLGSLAAAEAAADNERDRASATAPVPIFSAEERDRRWAAVRAVMAEPQWNLDAIIADAVRVGSTGTVSNEAFARYLTQVGGNDSNSGVVFPRDPSIPVHVLVSGGDNAEFWEPLLTDWTSDGMLVINPEGGPAAIADRLAEIGATRVGVAELAGTRFNPLGLMPAAYLDALQAALPGVELIPIEQEVDPPDPGPLAGPAMVKGPEELDVVRAIVRASERAIETLLDAARSGRSQRQADLWYAAYFAMYEETGEPPQRLSIGLDAGGNSTLGGPTNDPLREGQIITQEISARVQGYGAQVNHSFFVGSRRTAGYPYYETAAQVAIDAITDAIEFIGNNPGSTTGELLAHYAAGAEARGAEPPGGVTIHTDGLGNLARPRLGPGDVGRRDDNVLLAPGMTFDFKPSITMRRDVMEDVGPDNRAVQVGENILVTETGAVRLGSRRLVPLRTRGGE